MALQAGALRDALLEAGASAETAGKAAEEVGSYDSRLAVLTWMVGANVGLTLLIVGSLIAIWTKLGEVSGQLTVLARSAH